MRKLKRKNRPKTQSRKASSSQRQDRETQDLAENIAEIRKAAGETELKFRIRLELGSRGKSAAPEIVNKLNVLLGKISKDLAFK